ncbi:ABC transporter substrate-binding protein [Rhodospirillaceae bacterium SYSU D60014]|uniref:ABC transporter substrate-binding protein n=1 Tax=Virgifigura deserti TaxID=2268457 RepID=UPI0013C4054E
MLGMAAMCALSLQEAGAQEKCPEVVASEWATESQSVDPIINTSVDDPVRINALYEKLTDVDNSYQVVPVLAERWEPNEEGTVWTFHLREGVKFHDGSDFDASDVVYSFRRALDPNTGSGAVSVLNFMTPEQIEAVDSDTVRFSLDEPVVELPLLISTKFAAIVPDGATHDELQKNPVGTGPFMIESFSPGQPSVTVKAFPDYWQEGKPKSPCLRFSGISEPISRAAALLSGQADLAVAIDPVAIKMLEDDPNITLVQSPSGTVMTLSMWVDTPPFDDIRVRRALKLVVDRQQMLDTALIGYGETGSDNPIPPSSAEAYRTEPIQRDVEKAKELLKEAGYPDGLEIDLYTSDAYPSMLDIAQVYKEMAVDAGIKVNLITTPAESYWEEIWLKKPFVSSSWGGRAAAEALSIAYRCDTAYPETHWCREDFEALLDEASRTIDPEKRREIYKEAQRVLAEEGGVIVPVFLPIVSAYRSNCTGYVPNNNINNMDFRQFYCE